MSPHKTRSTRWADAVIRWVGWHFVELVALGVPLVLAVTVSAWWLVAAVLVGAAWGVHEVRLSHRRRSRLRATTEQASLPPASGPEQARSDQPGKGVSA